MRQRRVTGIEDRLAVYSDLILKPQGKRRSRLLSDSTRDSSTICGRDDANLREIVDSSSQDPERRSQQPGSSRDRHVRWYQRLSERYEIPAGFDRIYAEFGCGRGLFINTLAAQDPGGLYIGIEGCKTIVYSAIKKTHTADYKNLFYIDAFINDAASAFEEESLDGIFLNFSDPWPKDRHAERRLTAPAKVKSYYSVLKPGGFVALKTDKEAFFDYSIEAFKEAGFRIDRFARDLKASAERPCINKAAGSIAEEPDTAEREDKAILGKTIAALGEAVQTEYEQRFRELGQLIYYLLAGK